MPPLLTKSEVWSEAGTRLLSKKTASRYARRRILSTANRTASVRCFRFRARRFYPERVCSPVICRAPLAYWRAALLSARAGTIGRMSGHRGPSKPIRCAERRVQSGWACRRDSCRLSSATCVRALPVTATARTNVTRMSRGEARGGRDCQEDCVRRTE